MNMEHRQVWKNSMYEGSSRVPLFFAGPGIAKGAIISNLTQAIDVLPTLIELGGGADAVPSWLSGQSLARMLRGKRGQSIVNLSRRSIIQIWVIRDHLW